MNNFFPGPPPSMDVAASGNESQQDGTESIEEGGGKSTAFVRWVVQARLHDRFLTEGEAAFAGRSACSGSDCLQPHEQIGILHTARSFEAFLSPRFRWLTLQERSGSPIDVHLLYRIGALGIVDRASFRYSYEWGLDFRVRSGRFRESYTRMTWGKNEELDHRWGRLRHDTLLTWSPPYSWARFLSEIVGIRPFLRFRTDSTFRRESPDALQFLYGVTWDLERSSGLW